MDQFSQVLITYRMCISSTLAPSCKLFRMCDLNLFFVYSLVFFRLVLIYLSFCGNKAQRRHVLSFFRIVTLCQRFLTYCLKATVSILYFAIQETCDKMTMHIRKNTIQKLNLRFFYFNLINKSTNYACQQYW